MTDFFDRVERELAGAIEREPSAAVTRRRGRVATWLASHTLLAIAGAVVIGGAGATAAVVGLQGATPSPPSSGLVPRQPQEHRVRDLRYRLTVMPGLNVGQPQWCNSTTFRLTGVHRGYGGGGCGPALLDGQHVMGSATTTIGQGRYRLFVSAIVDPTVAYAVLTSGERVIPTPDPSLPNGWKAIVLFPGQSHDGKLHYRDAAGRPVRATFGRPGSTYAPVQKPFVSPRGVPSGVPCTIQLPRAADIRFSRWLEHPRPTEHLNGYAFLPCAQTALRIDDAWAEVTVLVDAGHPGAVPAPPLRAGSRSPTNREAVEIAAVAPSYFPAPGEPFNEPTLRGPYKAGYKASAMRAGNGWVVVRAKSRALRERLLRETRVGVDID